jgi:hypothetical protein
MGDQEHLLAIVWRTGHVRCEYRVSSAGAGGVVRLYVKDDLVEEREVTTIDDMLECAGSWRRRFLSP